MLLSPRKSGLTSLFKEVRVFKDNGPSKSTNIGPALPKTLDGDIQWKWQIRCHVPVWESRKGIGECWVQTQDSDAAMAEHRSDWRDHGRDWSTHGKGAPSLLLWPALTWEYVGASV